VFLADLGHVLMTLLFTGLNGFAAWANFILARRPPEPIPQEWLDRIGLTDRKPHPLLSRTSGSPGRFFGRHLSDLARNRPSGPVPSSFALEGSGSGHEIK